VTWQQEQQVSQNIETTSSQTEEHARWQPVIDLMAGAAPVTFGSMHSYQARRSPRRLLFTTSYYKFASKLISANTGNNSRVLDIGCGEGLGTYLVAKECGFARGLDFDADLIETAQQNWTDANTSFAVADFLDSSERTEPYDAAINFDVIEHIQPQHAETFIAGMKAHLQPDGLAVVGTPNQTSAVYASAVTNAGHVNLYTGERLYEEMSAHFRSVFMFGANDEIVHTGFFPMCHYLIAVGVGARS
jgi:2-polyprenyl-3-methyl-5-hydroxy-6-metoxy-1,4-benzoquinol methylase